MYANRRMDEEILRRGVDCTPHIAAAEVNILLIFPNYHHLRDSYISYLAAESFYQRANIAACDAAYFYWMTLDKLRTWRHKHTELLI